MARAPGKVTFYRPGRSFPAVSVTGGRCDQGCDYCRGHYLEGMLTVDSGERLVELALELESRGAKGFLLSGGCDRRGKVPLRDFLGAVATVKARTPLEVNIHTGLLDDPEEARALVSSGADRLSVDVVQDQDLISRRMHLDRGPEDYERTLGLLFDAGARNVVPHLCIGMSGASKAGEMAAIRLVSRFPVISVVLLSFLPARGTPMSSMELPTAEHVLEVAKAAVGLIDAPIMLGCMRARGDWRLEVELLRLGVRAIAMPSSRTVEWAKEQGLKIEWREECCALQA